MLRNYPSVGSLSTLAVPRYTTTGGPHIAVTNFIPGRGRLPLSPVPVVGTANTATSSYTKTTSSTSVAILLWVLFTESITDCLRSGYGPALSNYFLLQFHFLLGRRDYMVLIAQLYVALGPLLSYQG